MDIAGDKTNINQARINFDPANGVLNFYAGTPAGNPPSMTIDNGQIRINGNPLHQSQWSTNPDSSLSFNGNIFVKNLNASESINIGTFRFSNGGANPLPVIIDSIRTPFPMTISSGANQIRLDADTLRLGDRVAIDPSPIAGNARLSVQGDIQASGNLRLSNLSGTGDRHVIVDANGNLSGGDQVSVPTCPGALPQWDMVSSTSTNIYNCLGGKVGIATTSPNFDLSVGSGDSNFGLQKSDASPNAGYLRFGDNTGWKFHIGRAKESFTASINTNITGVLMTVKDNGNVGIGTTNPSEQLHIAGASPAIMFEDNFIQTPQTTELTNFVIRADNGVGRLISNQSVSIFINGDNNDNNRFFSVIDNNDFFGSPGKTLFQINENGDASLCGDFLCKKVKVQTGWCDFVFDENYQRMNYDEKEKFYEKNKHLPNIPSGKEIETTGLDVGDVMKGMIQNIEEDRLDITELYKLVSNLQIENEKLQNEIKELKKK